MEASPNTLISQRIELKFDTGIQIWILNLIFGSKSNFGDDFAKSDTKNIVLCLFLANRLLEIALPFQQLRLQMIKSYLKLCVICSY